tara:strand:- start:203 stop:469 length:267 start_codon:yes stop_codon:yes gene_type:complete
MFGSFINPLGGRTATALNEGLLGGGGDRYIPVQGILQSADEGYFVDESANHISYAQVQDVVVSLFATSGGDQIVGSDTLNLQSFEDIP